MGLAAISTPCVKIPWPGRADVWVKDESACPTGTFKDRLAWRLAGLLSETAGRDLLVSSITLGNTLVSLAAAMEAGFPAERRPQVFGVFPKDFSRRIIGPDNRSRSMSGDAVLTRLRKQNAVCIEYDLVPAWLGPKQIAGLARDAGMEFQRHWDITNGLADVPAYEVIIAEALNQCAHATRFDFVVVPVGAGVLFEETVKYVERYSRQTRVAGVTTLNQDSVADKIYAAYSRYMHDLNDGHAAHYPGHPRHPVVPVEDEAVMRAIVQLPVSLRAEPSAAAAFSLLDDEDLIPPDASVLVINTGNGIT